jgi:phosphoribosylanthranilate isomerase
MAVKIKICGIITPSDGAAAAGAGASYLGVVFAKSPRTVTSEQAREVVSAARGTPVMGVFSEQSAGEILHICGAVGLRGAQLHGPYCRADAAQLRRAGLEVWRVVRIAVPTDLELLEEATADSDVVLVEPRVPYAKGGAGVALDLAVAREARFRLAGHPMALAGGITPETVSEALRLIRPEIVDVSSGVEARPGVKDFDKIARFVEAVLADSPIT